MKILKKIKGQKHYKVKIEKAKMNPIKYIITVLSYSIFMLLILVGATLALYVADIKIRQAKGDFSAPKYNAFVVLTGSMIPKINVKDVVITKQQEAKNLKKGDVITYVSSDTRWAGITITHRIVDTYYDTNTKQYTFKTKGDNNNSVDTALVLEKNIYGKVIFKVPYLGYLQDFLTSKGGWIIVILIPCLVILSYDIMKLGKLVGKRIKRKKN